MNLSNYSLGIHKHRFACWCAATAASQVKTFRFSVETGRKFLELGVDADRLPDARDFLERVNSIQAFKTQEEFDEWHLSTILNMLHSRHLLSVLEAENAKKVKAKTQSMLQPSNYTFGIAAKLLNCYLKAFYVESLQEDFGKLIHPPIDRLLFQGLQHEEQVNREFFKFEQFIDPRHLSGSPKLPAWTSLDEVAYTTIIKRIKLYLERLGTDSLWMIESAWRGHQ